MTDLTLTGGTPSRASGRPRAMRPVAPDISGPTEAADAHRAAHGDTTDAQELKRRALHDVAQRLRTDQAPADPAAVAADKTPVREDLDSVEIELPDGRIVVFGPPRGVSLQLRVASLLGAGLNQYTANLMRTLMSVRSIDGKTTPIIGNEIDAQKTANILGEDGVDLLQLALNEYWPPATVRDLRVVKKNLR